MTAVVTHLTGCYKSNTTTNLRPMKYALPLGYDWSGRAAIYGKEYLSNGTIEARGPDAAFGFFR